MTPQTTMMAASEYYSAKTQDIIASNNNAMRNLTAGYEAAKGRVDHMRAVMHSGDLGRIDVDEFANLPDQKTEKLRYVLGVLKHNSKMHADWVEHGKPELVQQQKDLKAALQGTFDDLAKQLRDSGFAESRVSGAIHGNAIYNSQKNELNALTALLNRNGREESARGVGSSEFKHALTRLTPNAWNGF